MTKPWSLKNVWSYKQNLWLLKKNLFSLGKNLWFFEKSLVFQKKFGPYPNGGQLKEALKIIKKLFPFFDTKEQIDIKNQRKSSRLEMRGQFKENDSLKTMNGLIVIWSYEYERAFRWRNSTLAESIYFSIL